MTTAQTSSAHIVHRLIAWLTSRARRSSTVSSFWMCAARSTAALSRRTSRLRARSMIRPRRCDSTPSIALTPLNRNTGAIDS